MAIEVFYIYDIDTSDSEVSDKHDNSEVSDKHDIRVRIRGNYIITTVFI